MKKPAPFTYPVKRNKLFGKYRKPEQSNNEDISVIPLHSGHLVVRWLLCFKRHDPVARKIKSYAIKFVVFSAVIN